MLSTISKSMNDYIDVVNNARDFYREKLEKINNNYIGEQRIKAERAAYDDFMKIVESNRTSMTKTCDALIKAARVSVDKKINEKLPVEFSATISALQLAADAEAMTPAQVETILNDTPQYMGKSAILALAHKNKMLEDKAYYTVDALHNLIKRVESNVIYLSRINPTDMGGMHAALLANDKTIEGINEVINNFVNGNFEMLAVMPGEKPIQLDFNRL